MTIAPIKHERHFVPEVQDVSLVALFAPYAVRTAVKTKYAYQGRNLVLYAQSARTVIPGRSSSKKRVRLKALALACAFLDIITCICLYNSRFCFCFAVVAFCLFLVFRMQCVRECGVKWFTFRPRI